MTLGRKLNCNEIVELVTDYLEGALDARTAAALEGHLAHCPGCVRYIDQIRQTITTLGAVTSTSLSTQIQSELVEAFRTFGRSRG